MSEVSWVSMVSEVSLWCLRCPYMVLEVFLISEVSCMVSEVSLVS